MYWNRSYIEKDLSLGATSGTKTIDLPKSALISEVLLRFTATNGSNQNRANHIHDKISKIEVIVNGSEVVKSLTGVEVQALAFFSTGQFPLDWTCEDAASVQWDTFLVLFGRYPGDLKYMLDTSKVLNPQLKITWDTSGAGPDSTDLFSTSTYPVIDVSVMQLMDGAGISPVGYFKSHEITTWDPSANSEVKRVELPVGNKYRRLVVRIFSNGYWQHQRLANAYLDLNVGARQPFKMDTEEWLAMNRQLVGRPSKSILMSVHGNSKLFKTEFGNTLGSSFLALGGDKSILCVGGSGNGWTLLVWDETNSVIYNGNVSAYWTYFGDAYHHCQFIPFDLPDDSFMLDSSEWSDVDLVLEAAAGGISTISPEIRVVLEELIKK